MRDGRSYLIVGCRTLDVFKRRMHKTPVRKFDSNTGKPYIWEQEEEKWVIFGKEYWENYPLEGHLQQLDKELQLFEHADRDNDDWPFNPGDSGLIGYAVATTDGMDTNFVQMDWGKVESYLKRFRQVTGVKPEVFLFHK